MIDEFQSKVSQQGLARASKYVVRVYPPAGLSGLKQTFAGLNIGGANLAINLPGVSGDDLANLEDIGIDLGSVNIGRAFNRPVTGFVLNGEREIVESLSMFCASANIPARDIAGTSGQQYGEERTIGVNHIHSDLTLSYFCSEDLREKLFFESWQNLIFNPANKQHGYYNDYISTVDVIKYDAGFSNKTAEYRFTEAYPTNVGAVQLDYGTSDVLRIDIAFKFRNYERIA